jgi:hypothetical protein
VTTTAANARVTLCLYSFSRVQTQIGFLSTAHGAGLADQTFFLREVQ